MRGRGRSLDRPRCGGVVGWWWGGVAGWRGGGTPYGVTWCDSAKVTPMP